MRIIKNFIRMFCELFFVYASEKRNEKKSKGIMKKITKQNKTKPPPMAASCCFPPILLLPLHLLWTKAV